MSLGFKFVVCGSLCSHLFICLILSSTVLFIGRALSVFMVCVIVCILFSLFWSTGCDFMLDSDLHLWFIEANRSPAFQGTTVAKTRLLNHMIDEVMKMEEVILNDGVSALGDFDFKCSLAL